MFTTEGMCHGGVCPWRVILPNAQPCVCTRMLCVFSFQTLGVMADAAEAIATDSDVRMRRLW